MEQKHPVILFDGVCNLCSSSVQFIIRNDPKGYFKFAALQSPEGQKILSAHGKNQEALYSVMLAHGSTLFDKSRAALEIARKLRGAWPLFFVFIIIPPFIRNVVYDWISRNRYKWFGTRNECMMPTPELKARFLG